MRNILTKVALATSLALFICAPAAFAKSKKPKHSAAHVEAVKRCDDAYKAALREAKGKKGNERKQAYAQAKQAKKQCIADAPQ